MTSSAGQSEVMESEAAAETETPGIPEQMRAVLQPAYGGPEVLGLGVVPVPRPGVGEVLVRVKGSSLNAGNRHLLTGRPYLIRLMGYGFLRPRHPVAGTVIAGVVAAIGSEVDGFAPGDEVYGEVGFGGFAEYAIAPAMQLAAKPGNLDFAEAAALPIAAPTALQGLRDVGGLKSGQRVLINGASGGVGTYAVQIAKALGAEVTAVCFERHAEQARALGADEVVVAEREDFKERTPRYHLMLDVVGNRSLRACRRILLPDGAYVAAAGVMGDWIGPVVWMVKIRMMSLLGRQRMTNFIQVPRSRDLLTVKEMVEAGQLRPVIRHRCHLEEVPEAMARYCGGRTSGKTVVSL